MLFVLIMITNIIVLILWLRFRFERTDIVVKLLADAKKEELDKLRVQGRPDKSPATYNGLYPYMRVCMGTYEEAKKVWQKFLLYQGWLGILCKETPFNVKLFGNRNGNGVRWICNENGGTNTPTIVKSLMTPQFQVASLNSFAELSLAELLFFSPESEDQRAVL